MIFQGSHCRFTNTIPNDHFLFSDAIYTARVSRKIQIFEFWKNYEQNLCRNVWPKRRIVENTEKLANFYQLSYLYSVIETIFFDWKYQLHLEMNEKLEFNFIESVNESGKCIFSKYSKCSTDFPFLSIFPKYENLYISNHSILQTHTQHTRRIEL